MSAEDKKTPKKAEEEIKACELPGWTEDDELPFDWEPWSEETEEEPKAGETEEDKGQKVNRQKAAQRSTADMLDELKDYHLGARSRRELAGLVELLRHRAAGDLPTDIHYGLLIQCSDDDWGKQFINDLNEILLDSNLVKATDAAIIEELQGDDGRNKVKNSIRAVVGCKALSNPVDLLNSSTQKELDKETAAWCVFWEQEKEIMEMNPTLIEMAVVSREVQNSTWKRNEHLFYRIFNHHIFLDDLPAENIQALVFKRLDELGLKTDEEFREGLAEYIRIVYPGADLKFNKFVDDLVNRVLTAYYSVRETEGQLTSRCIPYYNRPKGLDDTIAKLNALVGMAPVKQAFQELYYQARAREQDRKLGKKGVPLRLNMAFVGNPGTGKTTVAQLAAQLLHAMGLIQRPKLVSAKPADLISPWVGQTAIQTRNICRSAYGGVLFIDEAYTLTYDSKSKTAMSSTDKTTSQCVNTLLQEMEENAHQLVVIFAGYADAMERFLDSNEGLRSRVTRTIRFPDYTEEELLEIFERLCQQEGFTVEEDAREILRARILLEKSKEDFGNARSVENIFQNIRGEWQKDPGSGRVFTQAHFRGTMPEPKHSDITSMIGLDGIKKQLEQFKSRVRYLKTMERNGVKVPPMNLHMLFTGNPGTGKTTVAEAIANDLYEAGVLKSDRCVCVEARDLIGDRSDALQRTERELRRAVGGVLFLDEAYALTEYDAWNVGKEVVASLIVAMEKHRGELVVILAGYPENMRAFLEVNPGLASRIGFTFHFRDYTVDELTDMFLSKMRKYGYVLAEGAADRVKELMEYFHVIPNFGNGRFVDKAIDLVITRRAQRDEEDPCRYNEITAQDIPDVKAMLAVMPDGNLLWDPSQTSPEDRRRTAVHEIGHALTSLLLEPETRLRSVSISAQALSAGRVVPKYNRMHWTEEQMMTQISVCLAGRGAERVVLGTHSTGCSSDYAMAKDTAEKMLKYYAMGPELGAEDTTPLLKKANDVTMDLLTKHKQELEELADRLLAQKSLSDKELREYLHERGLMAAEFAGAEDEPEAKTD